MTFQGNHITDFGEFLLPVFGEFLSPILGNLKYGLGLILVRMGQAISPIISRCYVKMPKASDVSGPLYYRFSGVVSVCRIGKGKPKQWAQNESALRPLAAGVAIYDTGEELRFYCHFFCLKLI